MSYLDTIEGNRFSIQCGDGALYFPVWKGGEKEIEYNTSTFDFINVSGSLIDRKKPRSPSFNLVFYFQGESYLDDANKFEVSASDSRPWIVVHPIYGYIKGQPLSFKRNDDNLNLVEITVPFWESIELDYPFTNFSVKDNTREKKQKVYSYASESYVTNNYVGPEDVFDAKLSVTDMSETIKKVQDSTTYSDFQNQFNKALRAIDNLVDKPLEAMQNIQAFLDLPATYAQTLQARVSAYESIYSRLKNTIVTVANKKYFETVSASIIASISVAVVNPIENDFVLVSDVFRMSERLRAIYDDYLAQLDEIKVSVYDVNNSFNADASLQGELNSLVTFAIANLYKLSFEAKREKIVIVDKDTNPILLVHRYIGLDAFDVNLANFIVTNNIKLRELFLIKKGREIKFQL